MAQPIKPWGAACAQMVSTSASQKSSIEEARHFMETKLQSWELVIEDIAKDGNTQLVLFPEFPLTASPRTETMSEWIAKACIALDGPEMEVYQRWASRYKLYIGANAYVTLKKFPKRFFNTSFLIDPSGKRILTAHRIHTNIAVSPQDMLDEFLDKEGADALFPVAHTPLGNLSMVTSTDLVWPEVTRAHILRGAEVILHPSSELPASATPFSYVRRARAIENMCYVVSCSAAGYAGNAPLTGYGGETAANTGTPPAPSRIFNLDGEIVAEAPQGENTKCRGLVDVEAVRTKRSASRGLNFLATLRSETFRDVYGKKTSFFPPNTFKTATSEQFRAENVKKVEQALDHMRKIGVIPNS